MKYSNVIIKCKNRNEFVYLQKYLFKYKYAWSDNGYRHRHIKKNEGISFIIINSDDRLNMRLDYFKKYPGTSKTYKLMNCASIVRSEKLKKLNNV